MTDKKSPTISTKKFCSGSDLVWQAGRRGFWYTWYGALFLRYWKFPWNVRKSGFQNLAMSYFYIQCIAFDSQYWLSLTGSPFGMEVPVQEIVSLLFSFSLIKIIINRKSRHFFHILCSTQSFLTNCRTFQFLACRMQISGRLLEQCWKHINIITSISSAPPWTTLPLERFL